MMGLLLWPFAITRTILFSLSIHWGMLMVVGLKFGENFFVPKTGVLGGSAELSCDYLLETGDTFYALQFYKDGHAFFRFFPGNRESPINIFILPGVNVEKGESMKVQHNRVRFRLINLDFNSGGAFKCEISADSPSFQTLHKEGNLSVIALPDNPKPILTGFPSSPVKYADWIIGNCTFPQTYPPPELTLYLNNIKINNSNEIDLVRYAPVKVGQQRVTTTIGVKFRAAPKQFQSNGILQIRCEAKLFEDQRWETLRNITHQSYQQPLHTSGQNRYSSGTSDFYSKMGYSQLAIAITATLRLFQSHYYFL